MKREDLFPSKYLKAADLKGKPHVVEIEQAPIETLKSPEGKEQRKVVLRFKGAKKTLPLNLTNYDSVAGIIGDDETNNWPGTRIELYPDKTIMAGKLTDCIRIRRPQDALPTSPPPPPPQPAADSEAEIPW